MTKPELEQIEQTKTEIATSLSPVLTAASAITITDPDSYAAADLFLSKIRLAKHKVEDKLRPIIDPIRRGLDELYALKRELDKPLLAAEDDIKNKMSRWKLAEAKRIAEANARRMIEEAALQRQIKEAEQAAEKLRIAAANAELQASAACAQSMQLKSVLRSGDLREQQALAHEAMLRLQMEAELKRQQRRDSDRARETRGANSAARKVKKWRVVDQQALVMAIALGDVPADVLRLDETAVNGYFRLSADVVSAWPGVEVYDDVVIAGRG